jgi:TorA maturation chaperone TorD
MQSLTRIPQRSNDNGPMALAWEALRDAGEVAPTSEILKHEYHDLFVGMGRGELVPFGSWYQTGFLMDRPLSSLRDDLKRLGFERQDNVKEPEDHIAALCETMAMLIEDQDISLAQQRAFFRTHIDCWAGRFFSDLAQADHATFYRAVGDFGGHFIQFENRYLEMLE